MIPFIIRYYKSTLFQIQTTYNQITYLFLQIVLLYKPIKIIFIKLFHHT